MDPASLSLIGTAVSGVFGVVQSFTQASAQADAAKYQQAVARNNQIIAQQNAEVAARAGGIQAEQRDMRTRAVVGAQEAGQGASGIDLESDSLKRVRESTSQLGRFDAATIMANTGLQVRNDINQATAFGSEADLAGARARSATAAGPLNAFSSLISSGSAFADKWDKYKTTSLNDFGSWSPRGGF